MLKYTLIVINVVIYLNTGSSRVYQNICIHYSMHHHLNQVKSFYQFFEHLLILKGNARHNISAHSFFPLDLKLNMGKRISCSENKSRHTKAKNILSGTFYKLKSNKNLIKIKYCQYY